MSHKTIDNILRIILLACFLAIIVRIFLDLLNEFSMPKIICMVIFIACSFVILITKNQ
jgi:predicted PurR-regulated permease PerM